MHGLNFDFANTLFLTPLLVFLILGGPLTLYAAIKLLNIILGSPKIKIVKLKGEPSLGALVTWDQELLENFSAARVKIDVAELVPGGRSLSLSFTFDDKGARKKSFLLPMNLGPSDLAILTDNGLAGAHRALDNTQITLELESTDGSTSRFSLTKKKLKETLMGAYEPKPGEVEVLPAKSTDSWSVLTRVFPWKKAAALAALKAESAPTAAAGEAGHAAPKSSEPKAPSVVDFIVTKVWIEPGCIVCDACENEAPAVFQVLPDTCIVRENAPLADGASIKAAAEGCPVNVIKFDTIPKTAAAG